LKNTIRKAADTYGAYILDMDGTLYHQLPVRFCMAFSLAAYYICHLNLLNELSEIRRFRADIENGVIKEPVGAVKYWMEEAPLKYIKTFRNKKLISFIELQKQRGALIAVYSDHPAKEKCGILNIRADYIFCSRDKEINCIKPDSRGLKYIVELLNLNVKETLYIGDRYKKDGLCAKALGMDYLQVGSV
jgi:HAD superfamily hydrolase (TIGR01549 family)